jgi:hypothetical protein
LRPRYVVCVWPRKFLDACVTLPLVVADGQQVVYVYVPPVA